MRPPDRELTDLSTALSQERMRKLGQALHETRNLLGKSTVWTVNSTAAGGGVAEMLRTLVPQVRRAGVDLRWLVAKGDSAFFSITNRLIQGLYGDSGDGGSLGSRERSVYERTLARAANELGAIVKPGDIVVLHDPQTAGLVSALQAAGGIVVWRCHVGCDHPNEHTDAAWDFLRRYIDVADAFVFSTKRHVPSWLLKRPVYVIPPSIDPLSPKNMHLEDGTVQSLLKAVGILRSAGIPRRVRVELPDGHIAVSNKVAITTDGELPDASVPLIVQVSRFDRLKDMSGVIQAFAYHTAGSSGAHLVLVAPDPKAANIADDPEAEGMFKIALDTWLRVPLGKRSKIHLVRLPMQDVDENALVVNAIQRHATVITQKSLAEGFGLTVTEAMWKSRPVVASAVGGIMDQIEDGRSGVLVDPKDLVGFGAAIDRLLLNPSIMSSLGASARAAVFERFLPDRHLVQYAKLMRELKG